jgi:hypothetical protein
MDHGRLAMMRQLRQSSMAVGAPFDSALAQGTAPATVVMVGAPPPSSGHTLGDQWWLSGGRQGQRGASIYRGKEGEDHIRARESISNLSGGV